MREYVRGVFSGVQDRYHLGAVAYGTMLGRGSCPRPDEMALVQRYLRWQGVLVVVLYGTREFVRAQWAKNTKQEMYDFEDVLAVNEAFRALATETNRGEPYADFAFDVTRDWPSDATLTQLLAEWSERWIG